MAEAARRSAAKPARGGTPNVLWVVSSIEAWPTEAHAVATLVTVRFPWGSLLHGVLGRDAVVLRSLAGMLAHGGRLEATISLTDRDGIEPPLTAELHDAYASAGLDLTAHRSATARELDAAATTWARKLGVGRGRAATRVEAIRRC